MKKTKNRLLNADEDNMNSVFEEYDEYNSYYESVSVIFRISSFLLFTCLLLFVVTSAFVGAEAFSYSNLEYITRNFALRLEENKDSTSRSIRYNPDPMNQFNLFGEGLAVCGSSSIAIYSATGRQTCSEFLQYRSPVMTASDKYVLIYDEGTGNYSVYNAFSSVHSENLEKPITGAVLSELGYYALMSSADNYNTTVEIYNSDFSLISRYNKNGYVSCVDISDREVLVVTADSELGVEGYKVEILVGEIGNSQEKFSLNVTMGYPLACKITSYGYAVVFADSICFLDNSGNEIGFYSFSESSIYDFEIGSTNALLLFKTKGFDISYEFVCLSHQGTVLYQDQVPETVFDIELVDSRAFLLTESELLCFDKEYSESVTIGRSDYNSRLYAISKDNIYYCNDTFASILRDLFD